MESEDRSEQVNEKLVEALIKIMIVCKGAWYKYEKKRWDIDTDRAVMDSYDIAEEALNKFNATTETANQLVQKLVITGDNRNVTYSDPKLCEKCQQSISEPAENDKKTEPQAHRMDELVDMVAKAICNKMCWNNEYHSRKTNRLPESSLIYHMANCGFVDDHIQPVTYNENGVGILYEAQHYHYQWREYVDEASAAIQALATAGIIKLQE